MATREENLKKINEELQKLDDDQLEQVAGGSIWDKVKCSAPNQENQNLNPANVVEKWLWE